jgi:ribonuclease Z
MIRITFLGTSAAAPTLTRNLPAIALKREGDLMLFDCGEGTQRQMMRYGTGFDVRDVFFTHLHADHYLGIIGFVRTLWMAERADPMRLYCPRPTARTLEQAISLGFQDGKRFPVEIRELSDGDVVRRDGYEIRAFRVEHRMPALGYALVEPSRPGKFDPERANALGIPPGPLFGKLQHGEAITLDDGRRVEPGEVVGPPRLGRKIVVSGDTLPCPATVAAARDADLLIHEATFGEDDLERAQATFHSTAVQAAQVARAAGARRLVLTHFSNRYAQEPGLLLRQARAHFTPVEAAKDGLTIDIPLTDELAPTAATDSNTEARECGAPALD